MIVLSNLRVEDADGWTRLVCDCDNPVCEEDTMWFAVPREHKAYFRGANYDSFLVGILYTAMYYREDVRVEGPVSKEIYRNVMQYVKAILLSYSHELGDVDVAVAGFSEPLDFERAGIGTGFSAGVDSFSTVIDRFVNEEDPDYKVNTFFFFNVGSHGRFSDPVSHKKFLERYELLKGYPDEVGVPFVPVDSNLHAYHEAWGHQRSHPITLLSGILALQGGVKRYYVASTLSYEEMNRFAAQSVNFDLAEYSETYLDPLLSTRNVQIVPDGHQHKRTQKTENIVGYEPTYRYLNVCVSGEDSADNCGRCEKCQRTLMALDSLDALDRYSGVFDLDVYRSNAPQYRRRQRYLYNKNPLAKDNVDFARAHGKAVPSYAAAWLSVVSAGVGRRLRQAAKALVGRTNYDRLKRALKG